MDGRSVRHSGRPNLLPDLSRVPQYEIGGNPGNAVRAAERGLKILAFKCAELLSELPHYCDVRAAEPIDGLPIIPHGQQLRAGPAVQKRLQQRCPSRRDVLKTRL